MNSTILALTLLILGQAAYIYWLWKARVRDMREERDRLIVSTERLMKILEES